MRSLRPFGVTGTYGELGACPHWLSGSLELTKPPRAVGTTGATGVGRHLGELPAWVHWKLENLVLRKTPGAM